MYNETPKERLVCSFSRLQDIYDYRHMLDSDTNACSWMTYEQWLTKVDDVVYREYQRIKKTYSDGELSMLDWKYLTNLSTRLIQSPCTHVCGYAYTSTI